MRVAVASDHTLSLEWSQKYQWTRVDLSSNSLVTIPADLIILDFLKPYFHWLPKEWSDSYEIRQIARRADCIVKESNGVWVGRSFMRISSAILFKYFNILYQPQKWVYLSGCLDSCQVMIALLFDRGYRYFRFIDTGSESELLSQKANQLGSIFMGIQIEVFLIDQMVLQRPEGSIFIYSETDSNRNEGFRQTISYFNFLTVGGAVFNLNSETNEWLKSEALATHLKYITEKDLYKLTEWQIRKQFFEPSAKFEGVYE